MAAVALLAGIVPTISASTAKFLAAKKTLSGNFEPFVDPVPMLPHIVVGNQSDITIHLTQFRTKLHRDFANLATMWGYNGSSPGPVIDVESGHDVRVHWQNDLPRKHVFPAPAGMMNSGPMPGDALVYNGPRTTTPSPSMFQMLFSSVGTELPEVRNITHLHGALVEEPNPMDRGHNNDGWPDAWNTPGQTQIAEYPNQQDARTLFYHDHAFGQTGRNVAAGLAGVYLIHDGLERSLHLPSNQFEIPLVFQSTTLDGDGNRSYTDRIDVEYYGNSTLVNGKLLPYLSVEPRKYRFRFVNATNARTFGFSLVDANDPTQRGPGFYQIASDAGFLEKTVLLNDPANVNSPLLFLASAERADIIVDFSKDAGKSFILMNSNAITDPDGEIPIRQVMLFKVDKQLSEPDNSVIPGRIRSIRHLQARDASTARQIVLTQTEHPDGSLLYQINSRNWLYAKTDAQGKNYWDYEIDHKSMANSTEIWEIVNAGIIMHPFHLHLAQFQVLDRRPFDVDTFTKTGNIVYTGSAVAADANEQGWKDVVRANPRTVTRIVMHFGPETGYYVYHCHILEHEDMDMMVPFQVVPHN